MSQTIKFYPLGNAETCLLELKDGAKILFDYADMRTEATDDLRYDIKEELSSIKEFEVVMFSHAHEDHVKGASEFFYLKHAKKYQSDERSHIKELWVSAAFLLDTDLENQSDAKIIRNEARYRLKNAEGIKIFAAPDSLNDWLDDQGIDYDDIKHLIIHAGDIISISGYEDEIEFFVHAPFSDDSDEIQDKNDPSIVMQVRLLNEGYETNILITGDTPYSVLDKIVEISQEQENDDRLVWDIYDIPHHCSHTGLNEKEEKNTRIMTPTENVQWLLERAQDNAYMIASCEEITEYTSPPHIIAKRTYEKYTASDVSFLATMEHKRLKDSKPYPIVFTIDDNGISLNELADAENVTVKKNSYHHVYFRNTEQFISDMFPVRNAYRLRINCKVSQNGWRDFFLIDFLRNKGYLRRHKSLDFFIENTTCPAPYDIYWKVRNVGHVAEEKDCIRGEIKLGNTHHKESTDFYGDHYVECYLVKNGICVAQDRIDVPIGNI